MGLLSKRYKKLLQFLVKRFERYRYLLGRQARNTIFRQLMNIIYLLEKFSRLQPSLRQAAVYGKYREMSIEGAFSHSRRVETLYLARDSPRGGARFKREIYYRGSICRQFSALAFSTFTQETSQGNDRFRRIGDRELERFSRMCLEHANVQRALVLAFVSRTGFITIEV